MSLITFTLFGVELDVLDLLDISQTVFAVASFAIFVHWHFNRKGKSKKSKPISAFSRVPSVCPPEPDARLARSMKLQEKLDDRRITKVPVSLPVFEATGFENQVKELLTQMIATQESEKVIRDLAAHAQTILREIFADVEVVGFASSNFVRGTAFGVAVPDVDLVASINPESLVHQLQLHRCGCVTDRICARKLQKSAVRTCTDLLTSKGGLRFRRTAFRGEEPKVTLLVPPTLGLSHQSIPIDFSVNSVLPLHNAALLTECGHIEPRAKALVILVRRWAKDRGICQASMGHMPPYSWTLLCIYFCQVGLQDAVLPPLTRFKVTSGLAGKTDAHTGAEDDWRAPTHSPVMSMQVGELFREFAQFLLSVDWSTEVASVRLGKRSPPHLGMELPVILHANGDSEIGPCVEDPFEPKRNIASGVTEYGAKRLREELLRASDLMSQCAPLAEILVPWTPPSASDDTRETTKGSRLARGQLVSGKHVPLPVLRCQ